MERVAERKQASAGDVALVSAQMDVALLPVDLLRTDGDTQMRELLNETTVQEYAEAMIAYGGWGDFPAVTVYFDGAVYWLAGGFHRVAAYKRAFGRFGRNMQGAPVKVREGTRREAVLYAAGDNARHGLRRTNADKRKAVETLLKDEEWSQWSDREIARKCAVSDRLVNTIRAELEATANIRSQIERRGADGRVINVAPIKAAKVRYVPADEFVPPADELPVRQIEPSVVQSSAPASRAQLPALGKCAVCGRPLSDPEHAASGCGPVCAAKKAAQVVEDASVPLSAAAEDDAGLLRQWAAYVRKAISGLIDFDPTCQSAAQAEATGAIYWSYPQDGIMRSWGRNVFLHPQGNFDGWATKLVDEYVTDRIAAAVAIMPMKAGAYWFQSLMGECAAMCLFKDGEHAAFFFGPSSWRFVEEFAVLGAVMVRP